MNRKLFSVITESDKKLPYYLLGVGCDWNQEHIVRPNGYYYQWVQCISGEGELIIDGKATRVKEGTGMLLFKGVSHEYYAISPTWIVEWMVFDGTEIEHFLKHIAGIETSGVFYISRPDILLSRIRSAMDIEQSESTLKSIKCSSVVYSLLTDIVQYASVDPDSSALNQHTKLTPLFNYIEQNFDKSLTLEAMADVIGVTPQHLCTQFKKITNVRIFQYINSFRIKKSKELLMQNPNMQIKEIAPAVGFDDVNYFCAVFKKFEKISPSQFRNIYI